MRIDWSVEALEDLERLYYFLVDVAPDAAARRFDRLYTAPDRLIAFPRIGTRITRIVDREVRRLIVDHCELRYEIDYDTIVVLGIRHTREDR